jgi:hypothetical protein
MRDFLHSGALLPLIPPAPFSHKGRRGSLDVLAPETEDGTQRLPKYPCGDVLRAAATTFAACRSGITRWHDTARRSLLPASGQLRCFDRHNLDALLHWAGSAPDYIALASACRR